MNYCYSKGEILIKDKRKYQEIENKIKENITNPIESSKNPEFNRNKIIIPFGLYPNLINITEEIIINIDKGKIVSATLNRNFMGYIETESNEERHDLKNWAINNTNFNENNLTFTNNFSKNYEILKNRRNVSKKFVKKEFNK